MDTRAQSGRGEALSPPGGHGASDDEASEAGDPVVLSLHQICATHVSNEYTQGPAVSAQPREGRPGAQDRAPTSVSDGTEHASARSTVSRSTSGTSDASRTTARASTDSASSDQRLLGNAGRTSGGPAVRAQPKRREAELKPLRLPGPADVGGRHDTRCARCGRCMCRECTEPRPLPACWLCAQRCVCSPESAVDHATCACCLKALFYHCSGDDEGECADKPFSCSRPHRCARWGAAGALSLLLPCLLLYLPARGCLAACQACHDRFRRPGCRCHGDDDA